MSDPVVEEQDARDMADLAAGRDRALNSLMERHGLKLFHYLVRLVGSEGEAADLAQETFVRIYQHRHRFDVRQRFSTWLYTIATNLVRDRLRWKARHPEVTLEVGNGAAGASLGDTLPGGGPDPAQALEAEERATAVRQAVASLPEELRLPLVLAEYEERSQAEIAAILQCSVKAVEMRIYRARQQLRERLQRWLAVGG
jgi:RNA polymerase sigma-70 factor (ECF subfamily)